MLNTHFLTVSQAGPGHVGRKRNQLILMILTVEKGEKVENQSCPGEGGRMDRGRTDVWTFLYMRVKFDKGRLKL